MIFRKRGITPDGFLLVVLLPKGTNGISKCQIRQRIGYKEDVTKTDDDTEPGIPVSQFQLAGQKRMDQRFHFLFVVIEKVGLGGGYELTPQKYFQPFRTYGTGSLFFFFSGEVRFIRRM